MFFLISKILTTLLRPLFWLLVLGIWTILAKNSKLKKRLLIISLVLVFLSSNKILVNEMALTWEPGVIKTGASRPKVAVVLGGYAEFDVSRQRVQFTEAAERIFETIRLYKSKQIDTILLSGGAASITGRLTPESIYVRNYLIQMGVDSQDIWMDTTSKNTWENAVYTRKELQSHHFNGPVLLVTSAFHIRRALNCFRKVGIHADPHPVQYFGNPGRGYIFTDFIIPSSEALFKFDALMKEIIGTAVYKLTGKS